MKNLIRTKTLEYKDYLRKNYSSSRGFFEKTNFNDLRKRVLNLKENAISLKKDENLKFLNINYNEILICNKEDYRPFTIMGNSSKVTNKQVLCTLNLKNINTEEESKTYQDIKNSSPIRISNLAKIPSTPINNNKKQNVLPFTYSKKQSEGNKINSENNYFTYKNLRLEEDFSKSSNFSSKVSPKSNKNFQSKNILTEIRPLKITKNFRNLFTYENNYSPNSIKQFYKKTISKKQQENLEVISFHKTLRNNSKRNWKDLFNEKNLNQFSLRRNKEEFNDGIKSIYQNLKL